jgi:hypothetical protein
MKKYFLCIALLFTNASYATSITSLIDSPGIWIYGGNIAADPTDPNDAIITISSSNAVIDLADHIISQTSTNALPLNGIVVNPNVSNITIKNGTIMNITGTGIIVNAGCSQVFIENILTLSCGASGIVLVGNQTNQITNIEINRVRISQCCKNTNGDFAFFAQQCAGLRIVNGRISNNGSLTHNLSAVRLADCINTRLDDIRVNSNIASSFMRAFDLTGISETFFINCFARKNSVLVTNGTVIGYDLRSSTTNVNNVFEGCISFANTATLSGGIFTGFNIGNNNDDNIFFNCRSLNNTADSSCFGFSAVSAHAFFQNCFARSQKSINSIASGFNINGCTGTKLFNCHSNEQSSTNSIAVGIDISNNCTECIFEDNITARNNGSNETNSFGFRVNPPSPNSNNNVFVRNISMRNGGGAFSPLSGNQFNGLATNQNNVLTNENTNKYPKNSSKKEKPRFLELFLFFFFNAHKCWNI